jgi:hypothetical protein
MLRTRAQRLRATVKEGGWADMREELLAKVLELLQAEEGGLRFSKASATVRLVCAGWKAVYDALVTRLVLRRETADEAMGMLVRSLPAVVSLEMKSAFGETMALTDKGVHAVSSLPALSSLNLRCCDKVTDEGLRAVSSLPALSSLNITLCYQLTDEALRAVSSCTSLTSLNLRECGRVTDVGVRALSSLPALTSLDLRCPKVTALACRRSAAPPPLLTCTSSPLCSAAACYSPKCCIELQHTSDTMHTPLATGRVRLTPSRHISLSSCPH